MDWAIRHHHASAFGNETQGPPNGLRGLLKRRYYSDDEQFFECAQSLERPGGSGDSDSGALARLSTGGADSVRASSAVSTGEESDWIK